MRNCSPILTLKCFHLFLLFTYFLSIYFVFNAFFIVIDIIFIMLINFF